MNPVLRIVSQARSIEELSEGFGRLMGLEGPMPAAAVLRAMEDAHFANALMASRGQPEALKRLLDDPVNATFLAAEGAAEEASSAELLGRVSKAFLRWTQSGFTAADAQTVERRMAACGGCENLTAPPERLLYRLAAAVGESSRVCKLCGCFVARKTRLPDEQCPAPHPTQPGLSRWGEPLRPRPSEPTGG
ncbi:hypothetical protein P2318_10675 [Myxococcaceae bacterium GXIMD 01537]